MSNLGESSVSAQSARDVENEETENSTAVSDAQEGTLTAYWLKLRKEVESTNKTPNKVVRRVLAHLRMRMAKLNAVQTGTGVCPLKLCPKEMWYEILKHISTPDDLISCARTCTLFKSIVQKMKTGKLFGVALPHIADYLSHKEILKCRLVCKHWNKGVDTFAGSDWLERPHDETGGSDLEIDKYLQALTKKTEDSEEEKNLDPFYEFNIPAISDIQRRHLGEMKLHLRNPFVGGEVLVNSQNPENSDAPNFCTDLRGFLAHFGPFVTTLNFQKRRDYPPDSYRDLFSLIASSFKLCPNLRTFHMADHVCLSSEDCDAAVEMNALPDHSCIRQINIGKQECRDILHQLLMKYSNQLFFLEVFHWNVNFVLNLSWENLTQVHFTCDMSEEFTNGLGRLNAPQLRRMSVKFNRNRTSFKNILEAINHFPRLTHLGIGVADSFESVPDQKEILGVPTDILSHSSIKSIDIDNPEDCFINLDFLLCFPFLRKLCLGGYPRLHAEDLQMQIDALMSVGGELRHLFREIVHINEYIAEVLLDDEGSVEAKVCMYRSNIWEILPFLQTLTVHLPRVTGNRSRAFTRSGYRDSRFSELRQ